MEETDKYVEYARREFPDLDGERHAEIVDAALRAGEGRTWDPEAWRPFPFTEKRGEEFLKCLRALLPVSPQEIQPLALQGKWFRASSYRLRERTLVLPVTGPDGKIRREEVKIRDYMEAAGRHVILYDMAEALPEAVEALLALTPEPERKRPRKSPPPGWKGEKWVIRMVSSWPLPPPPPGTAEKVVEFFNHFGPLGLGFRDFHGIVDELHGTASGPVFEQRVLCSPPLQRVETPSLPVGEFFGSHLRDPQAIWREEDISFPAHPYPVRGKRVDMRALYREYRETWLSVYCEAWGFKVCHHTLRGRVEDPSALHSLEEALNRSRVVVVDGRPVFQPRCLADACYLFLLEEGTRQCRECGKSFRPRRSDAVYCSKVCRDRVAQRSRRAKESPRPGGARGKAGGGLRPHG